MKTYWSRVPITIKVNTLILIVLLLGIGLITFSLTASFRTSVEESNHEALVRQARSVFSSIETIMLPGRADLATGLFRRYGTDSDLRIALYRPDGQEAFVDNDTIEVVNRRLAAERFSPRPNPPLPMSVDVRERFDRIAANPAMDEEFFSTRVGDSTYIRLFKPLINIPKCTGCHGPDHTVRGILDLQFDISASLEAQQAATSLAMVLFALTVLGSGLLLVRFMHRSVLRPVQVIAGVCTSVSAGDLSPRVRLEQGDELGQLGRSVNAMIDGLLERFKLAKYVSGSTLEGIRGTEESTRVERVLFFSDIRGFTAFSEKNDPATVVAALKEHLSLQTRHIKAHQGDIDKFVGDEVMAVFSGPDALLDATGAALAIMRDLASGAGHSLGLGIGIHCGEVIQGMIGSDERADFTVIGDTVNTAARLCSLARAGDILVSQRVRDRLQAMGQRRDDLLLKGPYRVRMKGKEGEQTVWRLREVRHED